MLGLLLVPRIPLGEAVENEMEIMMQVETNKSWGLKEVCAFIARLKLAGYKVMDFGSNGWAVEVDGLQLFRATAMGNERYTVRINERIFPDV